MVFDSRLVRKGIREPRDGLVQQARVHIELARRYGYALEPHGWGPLDTQILQEQLMILTSEIAHQADERALSRQATRDENTAIDDAKAFIRRLRYALPRALRTSSAEGVSEESFLVGRQLKRSTPRILAYLTRIHPAVVRLDDDLARAFGGEKASVILLGIKTRLEEADTLQETLWASLPQDTMRVYETKGRVLELIEDLNRAGKSAFDGDATIAALFNKDLILRARNKQRATAPEPSPTPEPPDDDPPRGADCSD